MKPVKTHEWSPKKRQSMLSLLDSGVVSIAEIIAQTGVPKATIYDIKKRGTPFIKARIGRPQILSATHKRRLRRYIMKSHKSRRASPKTIIDALEFKCGEETLIKAIHELGFHRRIARRHPALSNCKEVAWRETRDVRKCNKDGEVIGENKTKFKAKETR